MAMQASAADLTVFFKPNSNWTKDGARFALYSWGDSGTKWVDFTVVTGTAYYQATLSDGYQNGMIIARMNPSKTDNNFTSSNDGGPLWNQSADLTCPTKDKQIITMTDGTWGGDTSHFTTSDCTTISTMQLYSSLDEWNAASAFTPVTANEKYTLELDLTSTTSDIEFKILPNGNWLGYNNFTMDTDTKAFVEKNTTDGASNNNFILKNSTSDYQKYLLTATWEQNPDATANWALKIEGTEERPVEYNLCSSFNWSESDEATLMTKQADGTYKYVITDKILTTNYKENGESAEGYFYYKVTKNHSWADGYHFGDQDNGNNNYAYHITQNGKYTLTFVFDPTTKKTTLDAVCQTTPTYIVASNVFDPAWSATDETNLMTVSGTTATLTKTGVALTGDVKFKIVVNYGDEWNPGEDVVIKVYEPGTYTLDFTYDITNKTATGTATRTDATTQTYTVTYVNTENWDEVAAYAWTKDGDTTMEYAGAFPGTVLSKTGETVNGHDVYTYTTPALATAPANIIFTNNKASVEDAAQTADLVFEAGKQYLLKDVFTVTFVNTGNWDEVHAYVWNGSGESAEKLNGEWPGNEITKTGTTTISGTEYDVYTYSTERATAPEHIIFNNGNTSDMVQTADLVFEKDKQYTYVPGDTYTVAGGYAETAGETDFLFGKSWDWSSASGNDMTKESGVGAKMYTKTFEDVALPAGTIKYKVFKNYTNTGYPSENATIEISEVARYDVVFTYDSESNAVTGTATKKGEYALDSWNVAGSSTELFGTAWDVTANPMSAGAGKFTLTFEDVNLTAGNIEYKVAANSAWVVSYPTSNATLSIPVDGKYNVTFTITTNDYTVTAEATPTTIKVPGISSVGYATYSSEYALDFSGVSEFDVYVASGLTASNTVIMTKKQQKVPANTGLVLDGKGGATDPVWVPVVAEGTAVGNNLLVATVTETSVPKSADGTYRYFLSNGSNGVGFYEITSDGITSAAHKAYLETTTALKTEGGSSKVGWIFVDDSATGLSLMETMRNADNENAPMFNLAGQRVGKSYKGIVIVNGKKRVNK